MVNLMRRLRFAVFLLFLFTLIDPVTGVLAQPSFWQAANEGIEGGPVSAIVRNTAGRVLVSTLGGLYRLDEGQDKWVPTEITDVPTHVISAPDGIFYVIVGSRLYRSQDAQEWTFSSFPEGPDFSIRPYTE